MLQLRFDTPEPWKQVVLDRFDEFLQDHAANERKVSHSALQMAVHHPDKPELVDSLVAVAEEEMSHFMAVFRLLKERDLGLGQDVPDPYMGSLFRTMRREDVDEFLMDRLVLFSIVEARGCERFRMVSEALPPGNMKDFYTELTASEARHRGTYLRLAHRYFDRSTVDARLDELLDTEATVARSLTLRPSLH